MNIYDLNNLLQEVESELIDPETGEISLEAEEKLADIFREKQAKICDYGAWIKNLNAEAEAIKAEEDRLKSRRLRIKKKIDSISYLITSNVELDFKAKDSRVEMSIRRSESVDLVNPDSLPEKYTNKKVNIYPDKIAIKKAIKSGEKVPGAKIKVNHSLSVK